MPFLTALVMALLALTVTAEPVQYCRKGSRERPGTEADFCVGALTFRNDTTSSHDLFLTMTVRRYEESAKGWTAVGPGSMMKDSLMFIVYGDPRGNEKPIVSIRTTTGHSQPTLLQKSDLPRGMDLRVVSSAWMAGADLSQSKSNTNSAYHLARVSIICYSCHLWPGTDISAESTSQPWIWAWNQDQDFEVYAFDAHLQMHKHHADKGGWGRFFFDMKRSINTAPVAPSLPPVRPHVDQLGSSVFPTGGSIAQIASGPGSFIHGLSMALAFMLLLPAGVIGLRSGSSQGFIIHWTIQLTASFLILVGFSLGLMKHRRVDTVHQCVGIGLAALVGAQGLLGYWHHARFVRLKRRTWVSHLHVWLGRVFMLTGWVNLVTGLRLRGLKSDSGLVISTIIIGCLEGICLFVAVRWLQVRRAQTAYQPVWVREGDKDSFALAGDMDDEESECADADDRGGGGGGVEDYQRALLSTPTEK
ncbi:Hypothetical predicted protein [Lecanosticta acicola]|uniref:Cytochrome b561 domain-containing protein n=1 Tax=Lecanosticta acicola TaxID=111012 RepID=A0AAI8Z7G2_9PEZI|nr:Hypothetical predicted protein [Lecanosticta acicola]